MAGVGVGMRTSGAATGPVGSGLQWGAVAAGVVATFSASVGAAAILAAVVYWTSATEQAAGAVLFALGLASLAAGAGYAARRAGTLGWAHGVAVGVAYSALSLGLQPLWFPGSLGWGGAVSRLLMGAVAGALGGVIGVNL